MVSIFVLLGLAMWCYSSTPYAKRDLVLVKHLHGKLDYPFSAESYSYALGVWSMAGPFYRLVYKKHLREWQELIRIQAKRKSGS